MQAIHRSNTRRTRLKQLFLVWVLLVLLAACQNASGDAVVAIATATAVAPARVAPTAIPRAMPSSTPKPAPSPTPVQYVVQDGDTLFGIALHYGVTIEAIVAANKIDNPDMIRPGQTIAIPSASFTFTRPTPAAAPPQPAAGSNRAAFQYTVQTGDTLFELALRYGVTVRAIAAANQIADPEFIRPGQTILIPVESSAVTITPAKPAPGGTPQALPAQVTVNGIPLDRFVVMPAEVKQHINTVYRQGQAQGRNPRAFAKVGDSTIENGFFFAAFDRGGYRLGDYAYLQNTIDWYSGSFGRESVAVGIGFHTTTVLDMQQTNPACQPGETLIVCEIRWTNPSVMVIRLGTNDVRMVDIFERKLRQMVELALERGVIPVLGTKADRQDLDNSINAIIRRTAASYRVPLWDYDAVAETMPNRGLASDNVHPTNGTTRNYAGTEAFSRGHEMQDLTALMALDVVRREVAR